MEGLKRRLVGMLIEGPLEPSYSLLRCVCKHGPSKTKLCTSHLKKLCLGLMKCCIRSRHQRQVEVSADALVLRETSEVPEGPIQSALQVQEALTRRGLGLVFC